MLMNTAELEYVGITPLEPYEGDALFPFPDLSTHVVIFVPFEGNPDVLIENELTPYPGDAELVATVPAVAELYMVSFCVAVVLEVIEELELVYPADSAVT